LDLLDKVSPVLSSRLTLSSKSKETDALKDGEVGFNALQRRCMSIQLAEPLTLRIVRSLSGLTASVISVAVDLLKKGGSPSPVKLDSAAMNDYFLETYNGQIFHANQQIAMDCCDNKLEGTIISVEHADAGNEPGGGRSSGGLVVPNITVVNFVKRVGSTTPIAITGSSAGGGGGGGSLFRSNFDFEQMGIGGLGTEFQTIFRRAFASRLYPTSLVKEMGFSHVKGILLYGPPGCGKVPSPPC
jgi:vesicle-fusing ATPase